MIIVSYNHHFCTEDAGVAYTSIGGVWLILQIEYVPIGCENSKIYNLQVGG